MPDENKQADGLGALLRDLDFQKVLVFSLGLAVGAVLIASFDLVHFIPVAVALGILCFGFGIVLMEFIAFRRGRQEYERRSKEDTNRWLKECADLEEKKSEWEREKEDCESERREWQAEKEMWEAEKDVAVKREALRLLEKEAAKRGGWQIDDDLESDDNGPSKG